MCRHNKFYKCDMQNSLIFISVNCGICSRYQFTNRISIDEKDKTKKAHATDLN